jgi:hypothetical protein
MTLGIESPSVLFPALSLMLLAFTNRFLAIAALIRKLHDEYDEKPSANIIRQILSLHRRIRLMRDMQTCGIVAIFLSVLSIALIYLGLNEWSTITFGLSLLLMLIALSFSIYEIYISIEALSTELEDVLEDRKGFFQGFRGKVRKASTFPLDKPADSSPDSI